MRTHTQALHQIRERPAGFSEPIYEHYSLFKLGARNAVMHYASMLAPVVREILSDKFHDGDADDWAMTAPTHQAIPCAANLLCWSIADLLKILQTVVNIRHQRGTPSAPGSPEAAKFRDYSQLSFDDRIDSLRFFEYQMSEDSKFTGRRVVFINDINVTGAQQRDMERYFQKLGAATVDWVYLFTVDSALGKGFPQLEYELNQSRVPSPEEFMKMLAAGEIQYTTKCVARIMECDANEFAGILRVLSEPQRETLRQMVTEERRYAGDAFSERVEFLKSYLRNAASTIL